MLHSWPLVTKTIYAIFSLPTFFTCQLLRAWTNQLHWLYNHTTHAHTWSFNVGGMHNDQSKPDTSVCNIYKTLDGLLSSTGNIYSDQKYTLLFLSRYFGS